jgi:hypothetical protein
MERREREIKRYGIMGGEREKIRGKERKNLKRGETEIVGNEK